MHPRNNRLLKFTLINFLKSVYKSQCVDKKSFCANPSNKFACCEYIVKLATNA